MTYLLALILCGAVSDKAMFVGELKAATETRIVIKADKVLVFAITKDTRIVTGGRPLRDGIGHDVVVIVKRSAPTVAVTVMRLADKPEMIAIPVPAFTKAPPLRAVRGLPPIVADIESHLPVNHPYRDNDLLTYVHEGTHGVNSLLRNKYDQPAFYCLNNRAVLMPEPATRLSAVARAVPRSLRGLVYHLYLVKQQEYWENQPSYVFDEFSSYANSAEGSVLLRTVDRGAIQFAHEFIVYSICVPMVSKSSDTQMLEYLRYQIERVIQLRRYDGLAKAHDAEELRAFARNYFGATWTKRYLGF